MAGLFVQIEPFVYMLILLPKCFSTLEFVIKTHSNTISSALKLKYIRVLCQIFAAKDPLDNPPEIDYSHKRSSDNDFGNYPSHSVR